MEDSAFDAIVIGAGQAGPGVANFLVSSGRKVALLEADKVGGTCLNLDCCAVRRASIGVSSWLPTSRLVEAETLRMH